MITRVVYRSMTPAMDIEGLKSSSDLCSAQLNPHSLILCYRLWSLRRGCSHGDRNWTCHCSWSRWRRVSLWRSNCSAARSRNVKSWGGSAEYVFSMIFNCLFTWAIVICLVAMGQPEPVYTMPIMEPESIKLWREEFKTRIEDIESKASEQVRALTLHKSICFALFSEFSVSLKISSNLEILCRSKFGRMKPRIN